MILTMYLTLMISSTLTLFLATTPIILGVNILVMALLLSASLATSMSSWYAFLVFLIYIGGMLVMFAYFLALTPNQQMPQSMNLMYTVVTLITLLSMVWMTDMKVPTQQEMYQGCSYLYSTMNAPMLIILALILLLTMIIVVKLTHRSKGPLRPFNYV